jgi:phosphoglycolate phosphatase
MRTIFFDIDGTLLRAGFIVKEVMGQALKEVFGTSGRIMDASFIGSTDIGVVRALMTEQGFSLEEINQKFGKLFEAYGRILVDKLRTWEKFQLCSGVPAILEELDARNALLGLVTGNCQQGAFAKLGKAGLTDYFSFGAFGDESDNRAELCAYAHARAEVEADKPISKDDLILVGDSPNDIKAAHEYGIRVLAVASGWTVAGELEALNPTWLRPDLSDIREIAELLLS